jgi:hypothetical protein
MVGWTAGQLWATTLDLVAPVAVVRRMRRRRQVAFAGVVAGADRQPGVRRPDWNVFAGSGFRACAARPRTVAAAFARFGAAYRASGRFAEYLDSLNIDLADPLGDRVCETLRVAGEVGGSDLGTVLRTFSDMLRVDARTRSELETRQGWTVNTANPARRRGPCVAGLNLAYAARTSKWFCTVLGLNRARTVASGCLSRCSTR